MLSLAYSFQYCLDAHSLLQFLGLLKFKPQSSASHDFALKLAHPLASIYYGVQAQMLPVLDHLPESTPTSDS